METTVGRGILPGVDLGRPSSN
ncbi:hypothetical protein BN13_770011 [Nostocoides jenkinsii Ben 74]|uniref:Uncharacterized protein n=1 Tax=Nostocoides jenkinsii Ben 74 TaxID=1193518 RepID=A0A077MD84_9MICO|nr:hypothetical protein BN13_770011 [Tetrasphaera jenkinsii Ben 74]